MQSCWRRLFIIAPARRACVSRLELCAHSSSQRQPWTACEPSGQDVPRAPRHDAFRCVRRGICGSCVGSVHAAGQAERPQVRQTRKQRILRAHGARRGERQARPKLPCAPGPSAAPRQHTREGPARALTARAPRDVGDCRAKAGCLGRLAASSCPNSRVLAPAPVSHACSLARVCCRCVFLSFRCAIAASWCKWLSPRPCACG